MRQRYPSTHPSAVRGLGIDNSEGKVPRKPTHHPAGSAEKMAIMSQRITRGESCFHPADSTAVVDEPPSVGRKRGPGRKAASDLVLPKVFRVLIKSN